MQRVCFTLQVRPECMDEYRKRHSEVWPEMQQALRETGWHNYSLFLKPDGMLIGYLETEDFAAAQAAMDKREINATWQASMGDLFAPLDGRRPDEAMVAIPEVFHLD
ncbi:L-rhamnose mutarotase [Arthrobacter sp. zg-Y820]|nr:MULTISPECIES: L-rhamnose mutarotase [unclassified Arthrobacter]MCC9196519.1 L-rhamnose mutarotase [Arthrobacter sp. zg-Y820]MDK1279381.1 L-rhamnose mutarotase [Arthrobacter sp. zg.Y820]MDK1358999.1 L-rhamnose mutarotase [Arthrobacter sp. zg-Y1219]WIB11139.1 L-rhamnose mutarotase [Arthrobacter sp. zg-Y820]